MRKRLFSSEFFAIRIEQQPNTQYCSKERPPSRPSPPPTHKRRKDHADGDDRVVGLLGAPFMACELLIMLTIYEL